MERETKPVVVNEQACDWETWPEDQRAARGNAMWRTLVSGGTTPSEALTLGVARLPPGETLGEHHHAQAEVYFVLEGAGVVTIDGSPRDVRPDDAVFLPGGALHAVVSTGGTDLRVAYALAADSFDDVAYVFTAEQDGARSPAVTGHEPP